MRERALSSLSPLVGERNTSDMIDFPPPGGDGGKRQPHLAVILIERRVLHYLRQRRIGGGECVPVVGACSSRSGLRDASCRRCAIDLRRSRDPWYFFSASLRGCILDAIFYSRQRIQASQAEQDAQPDHCRHGEQAHDGGSAPDLHEHCSDGCHHQHRWNQNQRPRRSCKRQEARAEFRRQQNQQQNPGHQQIAKMFCHDPRPTR